MSFEITDLKEHDSELLRLLTRNLPDMLWVKDLNGIYLYANKTACDSLLMATDTDEPIGKNDMFFAQRERDAHPENSHWHTFGELCFNSDVTVIENNKAMRFEEYGNVRGKILYLEVYKAPFYDKEGNIIGTVGAGRDITQLKGIQHDLQESLKTLHHQRRQLESFNGELEKLVKEEIQKQQKQEHLMLHQSRQAAMGELLESIAHQWRQPLNIIGLATFNLETKYAMGSMSERDFHEKMDIIAANISYMSDTIDDFRRFLNPNRKNIVFEVHKCVERILKMLDGQLRSSKIVVSLDIQSDCTFYGVENEFEQVLIILLNNAIDAIKTQQKKNVITQGEISVSCKLFDAKGVIELQDNGGGIDPKIHDNIFEPYVTTKESAYGTGIGLYIAKNIIESRMRGSLEVENIDKGSCFIIKVPLGNNA
ncbi:MAG: PAS domain-containing sensor histidine kinase [Sulfurimonas sp.]|nr:PAS domain-containing sensor histidine kinase [Sulfurimonas sp.]